MANYPCKKFSLRPTRKPGYICDPQTDDKRAI